MPEPKKTFILQPETFHNLRDALENMMYDLPGEVLVPVGIVLSNVHNKSEITIAFGPNFDKFETEIIKGLKSPQIAYLKSAATTNADLRREGSDDLTNAN